MEKCMHTTNEIDGDKVYIVYYLTFISICSRLGCTKKYKQI